MIPIVKGHFRKSAKGRRVYIPRHWRGKKTRTEIPVRTNNPSIKVSSAEYDPVSKESNVAYVDEDDDTINYHMINVHMKLDSVVLDEQGNLGMIETLKLKNKKKKITSVHIEQKKDF